MSTFMDVSKPPVIPTGHASGAPVLVNVAEPSAPTTRKRRAYQVWGRDTLPNADDGCERWFIVADHVDAPSRSAAIKQATEGRPGTFATVLVGEWVEEVVADAQDALVSAMADGVMDLLVGRLEAAGVTEEQIRARIRAVAVSRDDV